MTESDIFERIRRVENLVIVNLILTAAVLGEKALTILTNLLG